MPNMFRNAFDAMIRGREAQAQRQIAHIVEGFDPETRRSYERARRARQG